MMSSNVVVFRDREREGGREGEGEKERKKEKERVLLCLGKCDDDDEFECGSCYIVWVMMGLLLDWRG